MQELRCQKRYFINLHCPYDIACIRYQDREYNLDNAGRLLWLLRADKKIERSLNNCFVEKWDMGNDGIFKNTRLLDEKEAEMLYETMIQDLSEIMGVLVSDTEGLQKYSITHNAKEVRAFIEKVLSNDYKKVIEDQERFKQVYGHIEILPHDLPMPLIIQLTKGCAYNECTFCGFYKGRPFRIKGINEVKGHIRDVKTFLGESISNMQSIFLGDANALMIEQDALLRMLDMINEEFLIMPACREETDPYHVPLFSNPGNRPHAFEGIYSFIDAFWGRQKHTEEFRQLKERNVRRIYIGLESGSNRILSLIKKCNTAEDIMALTHRIKEAGIPVGIMLIAGLGGKRFSDEHVDESIRIINHLNLNNHDNIYFSHLFSHEKASYQEDMKRKGINELTYEEENRQIREISSGLGFAPLHSPDIKGYEIRYVRF
ncbi:MAG: radical SAM protein [bacterium]